MKRVEETREVRAEDATDTISAWLLGFERVMVGTKDEKRETRAELESHLRDRARDLMLAGLNADEAARRAIDELGEAAEIAGSYRATRVETQRRKAMQVAGIGLAAGAAVVSVAALFQGAVARTGGASAPTPNLLVAESREVASPRKFDGKRFAGEMADVEVAKIDVVNPLMARVKIEEGKPEISEVQVIRPEGLEAGKTYLVEVVQGQVALREGELAKGQTEMLRLVTPTVVLPATAEEAAKRPAAAKAAAGQPVFEPNSDFPAEFVIAASSPSTVDVGHVGVVKAAVKPVELEEYHAPMEVSEAAVKTSITAEVLDGSMLEALEAIAAGSGGKVRVPSNRVMETMEPALGNVRVSRTWKNATLWSVVRDLNEGLPENCRIELREDGNTFEIAPVRVFDARETRMVAYRVSGVMAKAFASEKEEAQRAGLLKETLTAMVYRDDWVDNGGSIGEMHYAGGMLFVKAPERHHHMVSWILRKLESE